MDQWTTRITARAQLAEMLLSRYPERAKEAGLLESDLRAISQHGRDAQRADQLQQSQLAWMAAERTMQKELKDDVFLRDDSLRDRLPAAIAQLSTSTNPCERDLGAWLLRLSFARYRYRELPPASLSVGSAEAGNVEAIRVLLRVERTDIATRVNAIAAFCEALLEPGREAIVNHLAARSYPPSAIADLARDARKLAALGSNAKRPVEATAIEAEAVKEQRKVWQATRRMIRKAVQGVPELERQFASC